MKRKRSGLLTAEDKERMNRALKKMGLYGKRVKPWHVGPRD
jgi:hypothetical protein